MEQGLTQPAPIEINPKERNKTACCENVAELQILMSDAQEGFSIGIMAVNHKTVKPCGKISNIKADSLHHNGNIKRIIYLPCLKMQIREMIVVVINLQEGWRRNR
jgi:cytidine deaminase